VTPLLLLAAPGANGEELPPGVETSAGLQYNLINTDEAFRDFLTQLKKQPRFAFDTETDSLSPTSANLVGISISLGAGDGVLHSRPLSGRVGGAAL